MFGEEDPKPLNIKLYEVGGVSRVRGGLEARGVQGFASEVDYQDVGCGGLRVERPKSL